MKKLGKYQIEVKLGEGAMGFVYKARHPDLNDYVVLKTIQNTAAGSELIEWFTFEARILAELKHPNIVQIYEVEEDQGVNFIVMEYLNGGSLDRLIAKHEDVPLAKRAGYAVSTFRALDHAHRRKVFHRDIKPANIMLHYDGDDEIIKVVDFGIARLVDFSKTQTNWQVGAPAYMAPELLTLSSTANEKTDIWAAGVTLYELIAYQRPFRGESLEELKRNVVHGQAPRLSDLCSECPAELEAIVCRLLEKQPERRYQTVEDVLLDLEPVAKRLRTQAAEAFLRRAEDLYELNDFDGARTIAKQALQYDSANTQVRSLLQRAQEEIRRREVAPRLQEHLRKASHFLQIGQIEKARSEVQAALGLDSRFEPILKLRDEIEDAARAQLVDQKIKATKQRMSEGALTQAEALLSEAEKLDLLNPHVKELRRQLEDERQRRERRKRLNQMLNRARTLLAEGEFEEPLNVLANAQKEFPAEPEVRKLQEIARAELAELKKQRDRGKTISEVRKLIGTENFSEALAKIQTLSQVYPNDVVLQNLESLAADGRREQERRKRLAQGVAEIRSLLAAENYRQAIAKGEALLKDFPREYELRELIRELIDYVTSERQQQDLKQRQAEKESEIRQLLSSEQYDDALRAASAAAEEFPRIIIFRELTEEAKRQKQRLEEKRSRSDQERQQAAFAQREELSRSISAIKALLSSGDLDGAEALLNKLPGGARVPGMDAEIHQVRAEINDKKKQVAQLEQPKKQHRDTLFQEASTLLAKNDFGGATIILEEIRKVDTAGFDAQRTMQLESDIGERKRETELREQEKQPAAMEEEARLAEIRRKEAQRKSTPKTPKKPNVAAAPDKKLSDFSFTVASIEERAFQQTKSRMQDLLKERRFAEAISAGQSFLDSHGFQKEIADLVRQAEVAGAAEEASQKRRQAEILTVRGLLADSNATDARRVLETAIRQGFLQQDSEVKSLRKQIESAIKIAEKEQRTIQRSDSAEVQEAPPPKWLKRRQARETLDRGGARATDRTEIPNALAVDNVHFTLTGPPAVQLGSMSEVRFWVHLAKQRQTVIEYARQSKPSCDPELTVKSEGPFPLHRGARMSVRLRIDGLISNEGHKWVTWTGEIGSTAFVIEVPSDAAGGGHRGVASIRLNGCRIARMEFVLHVGQAPMGTTAIPSQLHSHRSAFASYSSPDLSEVLARVQGMEAAYQGLKVFVDVISLRSAQYWETELCRRIAQADVFYLFWCRHALSSDWVGKEWRYALTLKGIDFIDPVPLEGPEHAPPPPELATKHFNDPLLAFIAAARITHHGT